LREIFGREQTLSPFNLRITCFYDPLTFPAQSLVAAQRHMSMRVSSATLQRFTTFGLLAVFTIALAVTGESK
jgi:hypothetical protein